VPPEVAGAETIGAVKVAGVVGGGVGTTAAAGAGLVLSVGTPGSAWQKRTGLAATDKVAVKRIGKRRFRLVIILKVKAFLRF